MKTYIKPNIHSILIAEDSQILAGSGEPQYPNRANSSGTGVNIPGYSQQSPTITGDNNGNVEDMAKPYNPWNSWNDFDI